MKSILITGENSYIGKSLKRWLASNPEKYSIETISLRDNTWKLKSFFKYDVVVHVAGIAHIKETEVNADFYYKINRDLAFNVAQKAKVEGVKQFVFLSSMSVYGVESGLINNNTILQPRSAYGKSKLQAENLLKQLVKDSFKVAIIRPPMVYGKGCKGNYQKLSSIALKLPIFPELKNSRSMIFIDNLCEFIRQLIDDCSSGLYLPQNKHYVCTSEMVNLIAEVNGKNVKMITIFNPLIKIIKYKSKSTIVNKVFGDLVYEKKLSEYKREYCVTSFKESIVKTESRNQN